MNIKGIIFDKDGTLFDFQSSWGKSTFNFLQILSDGNSDTLIKLATALNFDPKKKLFFPESIFIAGTPNETIAVLQPIIPKKQYDDIFCAHLKCYADQKQVPVKNLHKTLFKLQHDGYQMTVATNDLTDPSNKQLKDANIMQFFSTVLGSDSGYGSKPKPSQLIELQKRMGLKPHEIVMVGDSKHDMLAAKSAGFRSFAVLTGVAGRKDLEPLSDVIFENISYLQNWLNKQNS